MEPPPRPTVAIVVGFFDWFSGYQETVLARGLADYADVHVVASNWVNPIFTQGHLDRVGARREYPVGTSESQGVTVHRLGTLLPPVRGMVWSRQVGATLRSLRPDGLVLMMPGQVFPIAATDVAGHLSTVTVYGDNYAMRPGSPLRVKLLDLIFRTTKAPAYRRCNRQALSAMCYTPDTMRILADVSPETPVELLPLSFDQSVFRCDAAARTTIRRAHGVSDEEVLVLTSGKFSPGKRLDLLVDAVAAIRSSRDDVRLALVGGDGSADAVELGRRVERVGLGGSTISLPFLGQSELAAWFNAADVGVWPTKPTISIQQAMGTGLPVVIPQTPIVSHLMSVGAGRWTPENPSVDDLVEAIISVIEGLDRSPTGRKDRAEDNSWLSGASVSRTVAERLGLLGG